MSVICKRLGRGQSERRHFDGNLEQCPEAGWAEVRSAIAAEGCVQASHGPPRTRHVEASGAAARAFGRAVAPELAEAAQPGVLPEQLVDEGGGTPRVGHQVGAAAGPRQGDVEQAPLLGVRVMASRGAVWAADTRFGGTPQDHERKTGGSEAPAVRKTRER